MLAIVSVALLSSGRPALAHGYILRSIPRDRAVLSHAPLRIQVWFSEALDAQFSSLSLENDKGEPIPLTESGVVSSNTAQMSARLPASLPDGAYVLNIRAAFSSDGHVGTDTLVFWVGQPSGALTTPGAAAQQAIPFEVLWRTVTLLAMTVLFGALLLYWVVLVPAWGNPRYVVANLPPRVIQRLSLLIWITIGLAIGGSILAVLQQSTALFATDLASVIRSGQWLIVLRGTQVGDALTARLAALFLAGLVQGTAGYLASRRPEYVMPLWSVNAVIAGAALGTLSVSSHAAGATLWPLEAVAADWLHLLAESAWIGGLLTLCLVLPAALGPLSDTDRTSALTAVLRRFSAVGVISVALLAATGLFSALIHLFQPSDLTDTGYGQTLLLKILLIIPLLLVGLYHHLITTQGRFSGVAQRLNLAGRVARAAASVRLEAVFGIGVLVLAGLLTATPPPVPPTAKAGGQVPTKELTVDDLHVTFAIDPGASGANSYEVTVTDAHSAQPLDGAFVRLSAVYPALDTRPIPITLDSAGDGTYVGAGDELDRAGDWQVLLDINPKDKTEATRAAFVWSVPDAAPDLTVRQPSLLNWLALGSILAVIGVRTLPGAVRLGRTLHISRDGVVIALVALVGTLVLTVLGNAVLSDAARRSDALRNPPPAVVNPILADAGSLAAGKAIYVSQCAACHLPEGSVTSIDTAKTLPFAGLMNRVAARKDAELYQVIRAGMGQMPPPDPPLTETDVWNVINYLRSIEPAPH